MGDLASHIQTAFSIEVRSLAAVSGGDVASAYKVQAADDVLFAKLMPGKRGADILAAEAANLNVLRDTGYLHTPVVRGLEPVPGGSCLLMEFIPSGTRDPEALAELGRGLARTHRMAQPYFGWETANFIGPLPQENPRQDDWVSFYARHRLLPLYRQAMDRGLLDAGEVPSPETMELRMRDGMPEVRPSLLHGDLWGGNYLISESGIPFLIDPACSFGHSEIDLAMSLLFGGFPDAFYGGYREILAAEKGWERRMKLYQLYYLLVHLLLFGRSYYPAVRSHSREWFGS